MKSAVSLMIIWAVLSVLSVCSLGEGATRTWTSAGDDGNTGRSAGHVMVWSLDSATIVAADAGIAGWGVRTGLTIIPSASLPANTLAGSTQTYVIPDASLPSDTVVFVSIKAFDEAGNFSPLGNIFRFRTNDRIAPAAILDLR